MKLIKKISLNLQCKFIISIVMAMIMLAIALSFVISNYYRNSMETHYSKIAFQQAQIAANYIDGDTILNYANTFQKDDYYENISDFLLNIKQSSELKFFYVVIPYETEMLYIWDVGSPDETGVSDLGVYDVYYGDGKNVMLNALLNPKVDDNILITNSEDYGYLASVYVPIFDSDGEAVALVGTDISMNKINEEISEFMIMVVLMILFMLFIFIISYHFVINAVIIVPVKKLSEATSKIVKHHTQNIENFSIDIKTGDELEDLAKAFTFMTIEINEYIENLSAITEEKQRIGAELDVATSIQASMLPCIFPAFPERPELDIFAMMIPAKEVGGDFFDFFLVDDDHLAMVMADVSGKGVPAALFMVITKTLIKNSAQTGLSPKAVLEKVNRQLCENNEAQMFVTAWLGILELSTGEITAVNAGHEYPVIKREGGEYELLKDKHGFVLAGMENSRYKEYKLELFAGDKLYLYTDGVPEATNSQNELYGTTRMLEVLNRNKDTTAEELLSCVQEDISIFVGAAPQFDDITMLSLEMKKSGPGGMKKIQLQPTTSEAMRKVTEFVENELTSANVPMKVIMQMNIAVDEIFSNISQYSGAGYTTVGCLVENGKATLRFADNGLAYDPTATTAPDITLSAMEREVGGLGIFMVKKSMDSTVYHYKDGLNILTLTKSFPLSKSSLESI